MVNLGCQDADWLGTHDKEGLDAILLPDGLILSVLLYESYPMVTIHSEPHVSLFRH